MAIIGEWEFGATKDSIFAFTQETFQKMWPDVEPRGKSWIMGEGESFEEWIATKEMVEEAIASQRMP